MNACPYCHARKGLVKAGRNLSGSQRFLCKPCGRIYTPHPRPAGYPDEIRSRAMTLHSQGLSFREIARRLSVGTQSVINWVNAEQLAETAPLPPAKSQKRPFSDTENGPEGA